MNIQLEKELIDKAKPNIVYEYQSIIESLIYSMIQIRSDICYAITILSRYNYNLNIKYIAIIKRVIRYIKRIINYSILYSSDSELRDYIDTN